MNCERRKCHNTDHFMRLRKNHLELIIVFLISSYSCLSISPFA
jgi:hypothetical protein